MGVGASVVLLTVVSWKKVELKWGDVKQDQHVKLERLHLNHSLKSNLREAFRATRNRVVV